MNPEAYLSSLGAHSCTHTAPVSGEEGSQQDGLWRGSHRQGITRSCYRVLNDFAALNLAITLGQLCSLGLGHHPRTTLGIQEDQPQMKIKTILCLDWASREFCSLIGASTKEWVTDMNCAKLGAGYWNWGSLDLRGASNSSNAGVEVPAA